MTEHEQRPTPGNSPDQAPVASDFGRRYRDRFPRTFLVMGCLGGGFAAWVAFRQGLPAHNALVSVTVRVLLGFLAVGGMAALVVNLLVALFPDRPATAATAAGGTPSDDPSSGSTS